MDIWNVFGDCIEHLIIDFQHIDELLAKEIIKFMNEKPDDLRIIQLLNCKGTILNGLTSTFSSVSKLSFSSDEEAKLEFNAESKKFSEFFPNVVQLYVNKMKVSNWEYINGNFSHLISVRLELSKLRKSDDIDESHVISFLKNNPTILRLTIQDATLTLLQQVNEILPNLDELNLDSLPKDHLKYKGDAIHFRNVKNLAIDVRFHEFDAPEKIVFDQLVKLNLNVRSKFTDKWMKFIGNQVNSGLKSLKFVNPHLKSEQILAISEKLPKMEALDITCGTVFEAKDVIELVKSCKNAREIKMQFEMNPKEIGLMDSLTENWDGSLIPVKKTTNLIYLVQMHLK